MKKAIITMALVGITLSMSAQRRDTVRGKRDTMQVNFHINKKKVMVKVRNLNTMKMDTVSIPINNAVKALKDSALAIIARRKK